MKKILGILMIAGTLVACNDDADGKNGEDTVSTSTSTTIDQNVTNTPDTSLNNQDTTNRNDTLPR